MRILLVEEGWHATLDLARGLEQAGHAVTVLTANGSRARCRHRSVDWISGPVLDDPRFALPAGFDHVIPLTEAAMARCWDLGARVFPATEPWQQRLLRDKHALVAHMAARGIAVPRHRELAGAAPPVVIKGATGSGGRRVHIAETPEALRDAIARARALGGAWIAQELLSGPTYLAGGVFDRGHPIRLYAAEKLEQHPPRTGGAIHVRSLADPALLALAERTLAELRWTGFASIDAMRRGGEYVLLEVNPRLWGSLAGAEAAGVELFAPFAALVEGRAPSPDLAFTANVECMIFPRYLNARRHRSARRALRDLLGPQGRDWRSPAFLVHVLRRLRLMKRHADRF